MANVLMQYTLWDEDPFQKMMETSVELDAVFGHISRLKSATDGVIAKYPSIYCKAYLVPGESRIEVLVDMRSTQPALLGQALDEYVRLAGSPTLVKPGSDYKLAERVFQASGQTLEGSIFSFFAGRRVVPLTASR